ncbi:MAG: LysR family transcriptional regulator [Pseudomonadota bacterium]
MSANLDIDLLRTFVVAAETGNLSRSTGRIGRSQAAISMQIQRLEEIVGKKLFYRTKQGVIVTFHGEQLLGHAQKILYYHDEAKAALAGQMLSGTVRFGCPDDYAVGFLPYLLRGFASQHPQVFVNIFCAPTPRLLDRLKDNYLDLALISCSEKQCPGIIIRREPLVWVALKGSYAIIKQFPLKLALSDPDTSDYQAACTCLDTAGIPYHIAYASANLMGLIAVVRSGQAIAVLTRTAVPLDLEILPPDSGLPVLPNVEITLKLQNESPSILTSAFADYVHSQLPIL